MKEAATVYVFDVDGVLCEIGSFTMDERVIGMIAGLLGRGVYCAINTGRGYDRVETEFTEPLRARFPDVPLEKLVVSTEMGGELTTFEGGKSQSIATKYAMSEAELKIFYDVWEAHKTELASMYVYKNKQAMASTVWDHNYEEAVYLPQKAMFEQWLREAYGGTSVIVTGTTESTDVHAATAGKNAGAANIIEWLGRVSDVNHDSALCFGDSHNDYEMARKFADAGFATKFIYTGNNLVVDEPHAEVEIIDTKANYTEGTVEFLRNAVTATPNSSE